MRLIDSLILSLAQRFKDMMNFIYFLAVLGVLFLLKIVISIWFAIEDTLTKKPNYKRR